MHHCISAFRVAQCNVSLCNAGLELLRDLQLISTGSSMVGSIQADVVSPRLHVYGIASAAMLRIPLSRLLAATSPIGANRMC